MMPASSSSSRMCGTALRSPSGARMPTDRRPSRDCGSISRPPSAPEERLERQDRSMHKYVIRRVLLAIPVLVLSSLIVFGLMRVMPGDALTALMGESGNVSQKDLLKLRKDLGLDRPYHEQYLIWLWQMVSLDPGYSIFTNEPIADALKKSIPVTLELATLAMILGLLVAIPIGVTAAPGQDPASAYPGRVGAVSGLSLPDFWLGTLVITFAAIWFHWIPPIGYASLWDAPWKNLQQFLLP